MKNFEFFVDFNSKKNVYGIEKVFSTFSKNLKEIFQKTHEGLAEKLNKKEKTVNKSILPIFLFIIFVVL